MVTKHITFYGIVQGIGFRAHVKDKAIKLNVKGWVKNLDDGSVEAVFSGDDENINILINYCLKIPMSKIDKYDVKTMEDNNFDSFEIIR